MGADGKQYDKKILFVYSRKPKSKYKETFTSEAPRELEPMTGVYENPSDESPNHDLPIAIWKKIDHVLFTLFQNSYLIMHYLQGFVASLRTLIKRKSHKIFRRP